MLLAKFVGGLLTIGAGLSLGREGPSIQLGAMAGKGVSRLCRRDVTEERMLLTCGASAGLSAAFNAPLAGVLFSLEELHKDFSTDVLLSTMSASITADFISRTLFGLGPVFSFPELSMMPLAHYWMVLLLGALLGLVGVFYNFCVAKAQDLYAKIPWAYVRAFLPFLLAGVLLVVYPAVLGGGHNLVEAVSQDQALQGLLVLFAVKFLFSMASFGAGVPGGIFLPLLVLGAVVGSSFSQGAHLLGLDTATGNFVILGMAGLFAAIVRAPVTGIVLISEMTGSFSHLLTLSLVSLAAYVVADLLHSPPVYRPLRGKAAAGIPGERGRPRLRQSHSGTGLAWALLGGVHQAPRGGASPPRRHGAGGRRRGGTAVRPAGAAPSPRGPGAPVQRQLKQDAKSPRNTAHGRFRGLFSLL